MKNLIQIFCLILTLCVLLCSCQKPPEDVGTLDLETLRFEEYTESDFGLSIETLIVDTQEGLLSSSYPPPQVKPYESVWVHDKIYFLGELSSAYGLYCLDMNQDTNPLKTDIFLIADKVLTAPKNVHWNDLQCAGNLLIWQEITSDGESTSVNRLAYSPDKGMVHPPFQYGNTMYWNDTYYKFYGNPLDGTLERATPDGDYKTLITNLFFPYEETCLNDGLFAYLKGTEDRIVRFDLEQEKALDALIIRNDRPEGVQCNVSWLIGVTRSGQVFAYSYESNQGHFITQIDAGDWGIHGSSTKVILRGPKLWVLKEEKVEVYDLDEKVMQKLTIPESNYSNCKLDGEGQMTTCDLSADRIVIIR